MRTANIACSTGSTISGSPWLSRTRSNASSRGRRPRAPGHEPTVSGLAQRRQGRWTSSRFDVGDLIKAGLRLLDELAEARPFLAKLGRMVGSLELLAIGPLDIVHEVAAVLAAVQADRNEARLGRHEAGALGHQVQHLGLVVRRNLDGRDLGHDVGVFANFRHVRSPDYPSRQRP